MAGKSQQGVEITSDLTVEAVKDLDWQKVAEDEAFMNEPVEVMLHTTTDDNAPPHVILSVNGINQPLVRGVKTTVKRKFVEVLARCWETKYSQSARDMNNPDAGNAVNGRSAHAYPFSVLHDPNPRGPMWLAKLMQEAT